MKINEKGAEDGLFLKNKQMGAEKNNIRHIYFRLLFRKGFKTTFIGVFYCRRKCKNVLPSS